MCFSDRERGWAVGFNADKPMIVSTADGGEEWTEQRLRPRAGQQILGELSRVVFRDSMNGWALAGSGIITTTDGGIRWRFSPAGLVSLVDFDVTPNGDVWLAGSWGGIIRIGHSAGAVASPIPELSDRFVAFVRFIDARRGWALSSDGKIAATRDGGRTWFAEKVQSAPSAVRVDERTVGAVTVTRSAAIAIANPAHLLIRPLEREAPRRAQATSR